MDTQKRTVTVDEAAKILGIGRQLAYDKCKPGPHGEPPEIPVIKIGRRLVVPIAALNTLLEQGQPVTPHSKS